MKLITNQEGGLSVTITLKEEGVGTCTECY